MNPLLTLHISQDLRLRYSLGFQDLGLVTMGLGPSVINAQCGWFHQSSIKKPLLIFKVLDVPRETFQDSLAGEHQLLVGFLQKSMDGFHASL